MRRILYVVVATLLLGVLPVLGQNDPNMGGGMAPQPGMPGMGGQGMMGGGMGRGMGGGQGMMGPGAMGGMCPMMGGQGMIGGGGMAPDQCLMMHIQSLGLTDDQMSRLRPSMTEYQKEMISLNSQIQVKQIDLHTMLMANNVDMKKVETQVRDINRMQGDLQLAGIRAFEAGKKILTPEQTRMLRQQMGNCTGSCPMMGAPGMMGGRGMMGGQGMMRGPGMADGIPGPGGMAPGAPMTPSAPPPNR